jgi:hypothetical protein
MQAYVGGPSTVVRIDEPVRVFATKTDIPAGVRGLEGDAAAGEVRR